MVRFHKRGMTQSARAKSSFSISSIPTHEIPSEVFIFIVLLVEQFLPVLVCMEVEVIGKECSLIWLQIILSLKIEVFFVHSIELCEQQPFNIVLFQVLILFSLHFMIEMAFEHTAHLLLEIIISWRAQKSIRTISTYV